MVSIKDFLRKINIKIHPSLGEYNDGRSVILRGDIHTAPKNLNNFKPDTKAAFSLAEVLVAMLVMSVFFLATTKVISVKQKDELQSYPHGYYECIGSGSSYKVHRVEGGAQTIPSANASTCEFTPARNIPVYNIYILSKTEGLYKQSEPQLTDDETLTFKGAQGLLNSYIDIYNEEGSTTVQDQMKNNYDNGEFAQFKDYLTINYSDSLLIKTYWTGANPKSDAVFIAW